MKPANGFGKPMVAARPRSGASCASGEVEQLRTSLAREHLRCLALEAEVSRVSAALERARNELIGTRDGERRARHRALHDELTGLPNRRCFLEHLARTLAAVDGAQPLSIGVLYVDLDGFKAINDVHGHAAGDALLRIVAARMSGAVRTDDMLSRLGGDEFACMPIDVAGRDSMRRLARKLFDAVSAPVTIDGLVLRVRPSIGIALFPADGACAQTLLASADAAMYAAKRQGSGHAFYGQPSQAGAA